jgi:hypothetical protein
MVQRTFLSAKNNFIVDVFKRFNERINCLPLCGTDGQLLYDERFLLMVSYLYLYAQLSTS